ncbi:hypothetical protein [Salana multivorans]
MTSGKTFEITTGTSSVGTAFELLDEFEGILSNWPPHDRAA